MRWMRVVKCFKSGLRQVRFVHKEYCFFILKFFIIFFVLFFIFFLVFFFVLIFFFAGA